MVFIMAKPWADGVLVTGKQADMVLVTGLGKEGVVDLGGTASEAEDDDLACGVVAEDAPALRRVLGLRSESENMMKHSIQ